MKSLNVKRIAAVAAGAGLMAAAAVGAAVDFDSTGVGSFPFFSGGEPQVKVVIGTAAHPADVVVGGNIAAVLGNLAYKSTKVEVLGKEGLSVSGAGGDLSDKKVGLSLTVPGSNPAVAYEMKVYVNDNLDKYADNVRNTSTSFSQTGTTSFTSTAGPKVITKDNTPVISPAAGMQSDGTIKYPSKATTVTKEEEKIYAFANAYYDTGSAALKVRAKNVKTGYEVVFSDPIPLCFDTSKYNADCSTDSDKLSKANTEITFLGDKWTIFEYTANATSHAITSVTLGKKITDKKSFTIDDQVTTQDGYVVALRDISAFSPQTAQFDVIDPNGNVIKKVYLTAGGSETVSEANNVVIKVNTVFPGAFANKGLADVVLFSSQLILTNGAEVTGGESHKDWYANIVTGTVGTTEGIAKIQVYNDADQTYRTEGGTKILDSGESLQIIKGMPGYTMTFAGLEKGELDSLDFNVYTGTTYSNTSGDMPGNWLLIHSQISNAFNFGGQYRQDAYVMLEPSDAMSTAGNVYYKDSSSSKLIYYSPVVANVSTVSYNYRSDESSTIYIRTGVPANNALYIAVPELTEENNGTAAIVASNPSIFLMYDKTLDQFVNTLGSTTSDQFGYGLEMTDPTTAQGSISKKAGYVTYRGSVLNAVSQTTANIQYAKKVRYARFVLQKGTGSATNANGGTTSQVSLKEGDEQDIGAGYSLKVDSITAKVSTTGTGAISGTDKLVPSVPEAAVVTSLDTASNPLVVLDSDQSSASMIVVGGQIVNTVAQAAGVNLKSGDQPIVKVYGSKLVVAGYTAADTKAAGDELIKWLVANKDLVRK